MRPGNTPASRWYLLGAGVLIAIIALLVIVLTRPPETLYPVEINSRFGYINHGGKLVILAQFGDAGIFDDGLSPVLIGRTWGYVDKRGKIEIAPRFEVADPFSGGLALVGSRGKLAISTRLGSMSSLPGSWEPADSPNRVLRFRPDNGGATSIGTAAS